jgi:Glycosyl hydrolase family 26
VRSPLLILVTFAMAVAAVVFTINSLASPGSPAGTLPTAPASYLGVYEKGTPDSYQQVAGFTQVAGRQPNLVGYYGGWWEPFKTSFAETVRSHGAATMVQWDPTRASVPLIASGGYDSYLRSFADSVRDFGSPVVIGFGHEMNAYWYSWGYGHLPASTFVAAWRHIVMLFRNQGADNVTWLWTVQADEPGTGPIASWWPGAEYVTWVGIDGYYYRPSENFFSVFGSTIAQVHMLTGRPVLLSETAVGQVAGQAGKIPGLFAGMREYGTLGLVWFDITQHGGLYNQDWHIGNHTTAEAAFRRGAAALTLAHP